MRSICILIYVILFPVPPYTVVWLIFMIYHFFFVIKFLIVINALNDAITMTKDESLVICRSSGSHAHYDNHNSGLSGSQLL